MDDDLFFDAHSEWLDIPLEKLPPNHYDLLGVDLNEASRKRIRTAAAARRRIVESHRGAGHDYSVDLLSQQITEAEATLLDRVKKNQYDKKLKLVSKRRGGDPVDRRVVRETSESAPPPEDGTSQLWAEMAKLMTAITVGVAMIAWGVSQFLWSATNPPPKSKPANSEDPRMLVRGEQESEAKATRPTRQETAPALAQSIESKPVVAPPEPEAPALRTEPVFLNALPLLEKHGANDWVSTTGVAFLGGVRDVPYRWHPLTHAGRHASRGVYYCATGKARAAVVRFKLNKSFSELRATVFVPDVFRDQKQPQSAMTFAVVGDGNELWVSDPITKKGESQDCLVSVVGVDELSLRLDCDGSHAWCLGGWFDPQLY